MKLIDVKGISAARSVGALLEQIPSVDFTLAADWLDLTLAVDWLEKKELSQNLIYTRVSDFPPYLSIPGNGKFNSFPGNSREFPGNIKS